MAWRATQSVYGLFVDEVSDDILPVIYMFLCLRNDKHLHSNLFVQACRRVHCRTSNLIPICMITPSLNVIIRLRVDFARIVSDSMDETKSGEKFGENG